MSKLRESLGGILFSLCELLVGVLLLINPAGFTSGILIGAGVLVLLSGLASVVRYFREEPAAASARKLLAKGIIAVGAGLFCILQHRWFIATFPVLTMLYGVALLLTGVYRVQQTVDLLRMKQKNWQWSAIGAGAALVFALIILLNPFNSTAFLWAFVAVALIVEAVLDVIAWVLNEKRNSK